MGPHHPLYCSGWLHFYEDGSLACKHTVIASSSQKLRQCLDYSVALLLVGLACEKYGPEDREDKEAVPL